jgi:hypothetical protein
MSDRTEPGDRAERDPFAAIEASPRFATPIAVLAIVLGVAAALTGTAAIAGPVGMAAGLVAHVKGSRLGMPATFVAAFGMIAGMAITFYLR